MKRDHQVILFLFVITLIYYSPVLNNQTHPDNINVLNGCCFYNRTIYTIILSLFGLDVFKTFFLIMVSLLPVFIYLFSHDKTYGFLYGLFAVLVYDKFIYYSFWHDSMCMVVSFSFIVLYYQNTKSILLLSAHRIENIYLLCYKKIWFIVFPIIAYFYFKPNFGHGFKLHFFFTPYQINDFGFMAGIIIISGFIGSIILYKTDERYKFLLFMALGSHLWVYNYGNPNPRYYLQFIILWYYIAFYPIYLTVRYLIKKIRKNKGFNQISPQAISLKTACSSGVKSSWSSNLTIIFAKKLCLSVMFILNILQFFYRLFHKGSNLRDLLVISFFFIMPYAFNQL